MPNKRSADKKCIAAWIDAELLEDFKKLCSERKVTITDQLEDLIVHALEEEEQK